MIQPEQYKTIKQPKGSLICGAAVVAMATGSTLRQAYDAMWCTMHKEEGKPYFRTSELLKFLGAYGIYSGPLVSSEHGDLFDIASCSEVVLKCPMSLAAIMTVRSKTRSDWTHYVFWDGEHVRDPHPGMPDTSNLKDYEVLDIMFLTYLEELS